MGSLKEKTPSIDRMKGAEYNRGKVQKKRNLIRGDTMKNYIFQLSRQIFLILVLIFLSVFLGGKAGLNALDENQDQEQKYKKPILFQDVFPLISESDLYCSFFILDEEMPEIEIISTERGEERIQLNNYDIFYVNKGRIDGLEVGQVFLILEVGSKISNPLTGEDFGLLAIKRGRARIVALEEGKASARVEKACGQVSLGHFLVPWEEKESLLGKDLGYNVPLQEGEGTKGMIIYLLRGYNQIARGQWAIIDLGEEDGLKVGQQLIIYRRLQEGVPLQIVGNLIVIDTQMRTSTVKILSSNDALKIGELVHTRTQ